MAFERDRSGTERVTAIMAARAVTHRLASMDVDAIVTGSLARGRFQPHSDIDLLVLECPKHLKYAIEGIVEDELSAIPFDVIYLDDVPEWKRASFLAGALHASQLG